MAAVPGRSPAEIVYCSPEQFFAMLPSEFLVEDHWSGPHIDWGYRLVYPDFGLATNAREPEPTPEPVNEDPVKRLRLPRHPETYKVEWATVVGAWIALCCLAVVTAAAYAVVAFLVRAAQ